MTTPFRFLQFMAIATLAFIAGVLVGRTHHRNNQPTVSNGMFCPDDGITCWKARVDEGTVTIWLADRPR